MFRFSTHSDTTTADLAVTRAGDTLSDKYDGFIPQPARHGEERPERIAIAHDYLAQSGGAERVVIAIHGMYPNAPIYTSVYDSSSAPIWFRDKKIHTSFLQKLPFRSQAMHKLALPLYPVAFEQFDMTAYDLVVSSSSSFAKGIITSPQTCHLCYCHTPPRFAWRHHEYISRGRITRILSPLLSGILSRLRTWDVISANRVDYFIANSQNIARRIKKYYRRDAVVIYPPVEVHRFQPAPTSQVTENLLVVSRLVGYKRIDLAVLVSNKMGVPLRVVGEGPDLRHLQKIAGPNVTFLGRLSDAEVAREMAVCKALIFPGEEDFGITPLECMASGRPVVAYAAGGALETVVEGKTGVFFRAQTVESLEAAITDLKYIDFHADVLTAHARQFDIEVFLKRFREYADWAYADFTFQEHGPPADARSKASVA